MELDHAKKINDKQFLYLHSYINKLNYSIYKVASFDQHRGNWILDLSKSPLEGETLFNTLK